jgi:ABC-2 type transport system ATP-binding protein
VDTAIITRDLTRTFPGPPGQPPAVAVERLNLVVPAGSLVGLLGPNGAGKTTTVKMLTTLLLPTAGTATIAGYDLVRDVNAVRRAIGFSFGGDRGLYTRATARENLQYFANLYGLPWRIGQARIHDMLALVGLENRSREPVERFSRGMKQRLHLARALLHDPAVLFLDEPSTGLDPWAARDVRLLLRSLRQQGKTIVLTTHSMPEAEELCDYIVILGHGTVLQAGTVSELRRLVGVTTIIELEGTWIDPSQVTVWRVAPGVLAVREETRDGLHLVTVECNDRDHALALADAMAAAYPDHRLATRSPTLEDAYLRLTQGTEGGYRLAIRA